jgi:cytochrome c553
MKRVFKFLGYTLAALLASLLVVVAVVFWRSNARLAQHFPVAVRPVKIPTDAAAVERGKHIAETRGCNDCHGKDYAGGKVIEDGAMGRLYAPNLTRGLGGRTASFTDDDWVRAIRHGVGPDGGGLFIMPSLEYSHFSDEDLGAVIAYLKTVPPVSRERVPTKLGPVSRILLTIGKMKLDAELIDHADLQPPSVTPGVTVEYGRYIAASCTGCHGKNCAGGKIEIGPPDWPPAANLTPAGNLGKWTEAEFINTLRTAHRPDGTELSTVMPRAFGQMTDDELKALWLFFKSLPAAATGAR